MSGVRQVTGSFDCCWTAGRPKKTKSDGNGFIGAGIPPVLPVWTFASTDIIVDNLFHGSHITLMATNLGSSQPSHVQLLPVWSSVSIFVGGGYGHLNTIVAVTAAGYDRL